MAWMIGLGGCGGSGDTATPGTPVPVLPGTQTPPPADITPVRWTELLRETLSEGEAPPSECIYPRRFTINPVGNIAAGPCAPDGEEFHGSLSPEEMGQITSVAARVLAADPRDTEECDPSTLPLKNNVWMTLSTEYMYTVYGNAPHGQTCYSGGKANADELQKTMAQLEAKYYPKREAHH